MNITYMIHMSGERRTFPLGAYNTDSSNIKRYTVYRVTKMLHIRYTSNYTLFRHTESTVDSS